MNGSIRKLESKIEIRLLSMFWIFVMMHFGVSYLLCNPLSCFNNIMRNESYTMVVFLSIFFILVLLFPKG